MLSGRKPSGEVQLRHWVLRKKMAVPQRHLYERVSFSPVLRSFHSVVRRLAIDSIRSSTRSSSADAMASFHGGIEHAAVKHTHSRDVAAPFAAVTAALCHQFVSLKISSTFARTRTGIGIAS